MSNPSSMNLYREAAATLTDVRGALSGFGGLVPGRGPRPVVSAQFAEAENSCCLPTHCFRTVSQRSLNVPTRFSSQLVATGAGVDCIPGIITDVGTGAFPGLGLLTDEEFFFNNANIQRNGREFTTWF